MIISDLGVVIIKDIARSQVFQGRKKTGRMDIVVDWMKVLS